MVDKNPYKVIKHVHVTEKTRVLQELKDATSNPSLTRCESPKYVFVVDSSANKREIASAVELIYAEKKVRVKAVNTINAKPKPKRMRGKRGRTAGFKKAVVTLEKGDDLGELN